MNRRKHKKAFSLIEVTLALVVLSAGAVGILLLLTHSLDSATLATNRMRSAVFADMIFNTLYSSSREVASGGSNEWMSFWMELSEGESGIPVPCPDMWLPENMWIQKGTHTLIFSNNEFHISLTNNTLAFAIRYTMEIEMFYTNDFPYIAKVFLKVAGGEFEAKPVADDAYFYSEFFYNSTP